MNRGFNSRQSVSPSHSIVMASAVLMFYLDEEGTHTHAQTHTHTPTHTHTHTHTHMHIPSLWSLPTWPHATLFDPPWLPSSPSLIASLPAPPNPALSHLTLPCK